MDGTEYKTLSVNDFLNIKGPRNVIAIKKTPIDSVLKDRIGRLS